MSAGTEDVADPVHPDTVERYRRLQQKVREYRAEALRCREIARMLAQARGTNAVLASVYEDPKKKGNLLMFICAPNLDESNLGEASGMIIREFWEGVARASGKDMGPSPTVTSVKIQGTEGDK